MSDGTGLKGGHLEMVSVHHYSFLPQPHSGSKIKMMLLLKMGMCVLRLHSRLTEQL